MQNYNFISFSAGPTYISDKTLQALHEIVSSGFLSVSHRSPEFTEVSKKAIEGLREKMNIPKDYHIFYQNSSTVAWDTVLQNLVREHSFHFVCGEFSRRFHNTAEQLQLDAKIHDTPSGMAVEVEKANIPKETELIAITHNETRSGLMWPFEKIRQVREMNPNALLAIDVCSSFGGMVMDWTMADVWLGSVQKCLTMPPGLAYLIVSPRAFEKGLKINRKIPAWRRFEVMRDMMKVYQIYETPNSLNIALLAKLMESWDLEAIEKETRRKAKLIYSAKMNWEPHVKDPAWQSITSAHFMVDDAEKWHKAAEASNFVLGRSFGQHAENGIRICNFPSHTYEIMESLLQALRGVR